MNRRTVLRSAAVVGCVSLAGCVDGVREHFEGDVRGIVPLEIHSEAEEHRNLHIQAHERETNRQTYDQGITVTPGETVGPPHLSAAEQRLQVATIDDDDEVADFQEVSITPNTQLVLIWIYDDELVIEVDRGDGNETVDETDDPDAVEDLEDLEDDGVSDDDTDQ